MSLSPPPPDSSEPQLLISHHPDRLVTLQKVPLPYRPQPAPTSRLIAAVPRPAICPQTLPSVSSSLPAMATAAASTVRTGTLMKRTQQLTWRNRNRRGPQDLRGVRHRPDRARRAAELPARPAPRGSLRGDRRVDCDRQAQQGGVRRLASQLDGGCGRRRQRHLRFGAGVLAGCVSFCFSSAECALIQTLLLSRLLPASCQCLVDDARQRHDGRLASERLSVRQGQHRPSRGRHRL